MYAIVDLETTGGSFKYERIIEVGIVVHDGNEILEEFQSLVNPERPIPYNITRLTGITNDMVREAPRFFEIAKKIVELTEDKVFVAHNVNFDYNFLREEYKSLGFQFSRKKVCTVQLSRKLLPGLDSYSLGSLSKRFEITNDARHRALGDAKATAKLLELMISRDDKGLLRKAINRNPVLSGLHEHLNPEDLRKLPKSAGVYFFWDDSGHLIYVGKSLHIRDRIMSHLNNQSPGKYQEMKSMIAKVTYELWPGELASLLREAQLILEHKPYFNRALKTREVRYHLTPFIGINGLSGIQIKSGKEDPDALFSFRSLWTARQFLQGLAEEFEFCPDFTPESAAMLEDCEFARVSNCPGACQGKADIEAYNATMDLVFDSFRLPDDQLAIVEQEGESWVAILLFDRQVYGLLRGEGKFKKEFLRELKKDSIHRFSTSRQLRKLVMQHLRKEDEGIVKWSLSADFGSKVEG